jgi:anti-sigma regulatory factor (Ser/Thr protein kinase)
VRIYIPNSAFLGNIDPFFRGFDPSSRDVLQITANEKWISVHPIVLSMIAALGLTVKPGNIQCEKLEAASKHYLVRMGLFKILNVFSEISIVEHEAAGRFIPITQIRTSDELTKFITEMIPLLHLEAEQARTLGYIVSELVRNVLEHAEAEQGAILCAQYYKKSNAIRIGIADTGVGIKTTINRSWPAKTDLEAIQLALTPGITGTTRREGGTEQNAGAGLFFIKSIASVNRDFFVIYSGNGFYKLLKKPPAKRLSLNADPFRDRHSIAEDLPTWRGTLVGVDITLDQTEEFSILLEVIRKTYSMAVKERKKARYKKPIVIFDKAGEFAENKDIARDIRVREILPALEKNEDVTLDFQRVGAATQSFVHALISDVLRKYSDDALDRISFKSCNETVKQIISIVVDYMQEGS